MIEVIISSDLVKTKGGECETKGVKAICRLKQPYIDLYPSLRMQSFACLGIGGTYLHNLEHDESSDIQID